MSQHTAQLSYRTLQNSELYRTGGGGSLGPAHVGTLPLDSCFVYLGGNTQKVGPALEPAARCSCSTRAPLSLSART